MDIAKEAVGPSETVVFHNASLLRHKSLPLYSGVCNVTVVDSSLDPTWQIREGSHSNPRIIRGSRRQM